MQHSVPNLCCHVQSQFIKARSPFQEKLWPIADAVKSEIAPHSIPLLTGGSRGVNGQCVKKITAFV
jgi:hypothetical protein